MRITADQLLNGAKTVTRRIGWKFLKPGDRVRAVRKVRGLLGEIEIVCVYQDPLKDIDRDDVSREGFPGMTRAKFVKMFCGHMGGTKHQIVTRIEFKQIEYDVPPYL